MPTQLPFPQIGKAIASTGSAHFPRRLHDLIRTQLTVDATHICQSRIGPDDSDTPLLCETVLSAPDVALCDSACLHLARRKNGYHYQITVLRAACTEGFSPDERNLLEDISPLLLPMLEKHGDALRPPAEAAPRAAQESLQARFLERLAQSGPSLSERERQVCLGLLAGHTAPQQAEHLALKISTVESYLRRAAIKLGISGRHSLMRWMYGCEAAPRSH
ncbi:MULTISPECIES: helix-turn-helix transcriptional regulator [unclassified Pseudomonas]|uniref:helix-turn-helix transcriptional regulator n=1 Tax=unclassified Pseudomonas TaxID=196821 RepID=UPI00244754BD|nr:MULTISPECIES: helix-turn-helix transcriptional regulator [unclassified Pseudomonas]MDH0301932.1 helix-turn-helix transcriptional regulator [Pseudomonas sp. GD04091]MDH1983780.1 helix-turn-helix transcriptional regulator [Pseudomonas sp. GD03689]